jgi:3-oxoacyl-[acyl-carrier-protein] synthase-3
MGAMTQSVEILGTGSWLPEQVIPNAFFAKRLNIKESDIVKRTGVIERRWVSEKEASSDLATHASIRALQQAGIEGKDLGMIILSSTSPDMAFPSSAALLQMNLKGGNIPAFDIQASCSGFLFALSIADNFLKQSDAKYALVASGEVKSRMLDLADPGSSILFGDGGGAVVLSKSERESGFLSFHLHSDGTKQDYIQLPGGGSRIPPSARTLKEGLHTLRMRGKAVYRSAIEYFGNAIEEALAYNGIEIGQIACFVFHQANQRLLEKIMERFRIPSEKVEFTIHKYGNTSSASLPITLDQAVSKKNFKRGDLLLFASFGGGITWASAVYKW